MFHSGSIFLTYFCLLWSLYCSDTSNVASILARGGKEVQGFRTNDGERVTCKLRKYSDIYYYGNLITIKGSIESAEMCGVTCWKFGKRCQSANYFEETESCELLQDRLDVTNTYALRYKAEQNYDAVYVVPLTCIQGEQPKPTPVKPQTTPVPVKPQTVPAPATPEKPPASCGQTFIEPNIPRGALSRRAGQRIVGGIKATPHSLPWQVSLRAGYFWITHFCGGTLVPVRDNKETDIVITAAHCLPEKPENFQVAAGAHDSKQMAEGEQRVNVSTYVLHPGFNHETIVNDIAIVKLAKPVRFSRTIQPACLPSPGERVPDGTPGLVSGWGRLNDHGPLPLELMQVIVPTISSDLCASSYKVITDPINIVPDVMLCAGYMAGEKDACEGDSGGPLVFKTSRGFVLHGVVSFGDGCAEAGKPGVYSRVTKFIESGWISEKIKELSSLA